MSTEQTPDDSQRSSLRSIYLAVAAVIAWTVVRVAATFWPASMGGHTGLSDAELTFEVGLYVLLTYGLLRWSRTCALFLFLLICPSAVVTAIGSGKPGRALFALGVSSLLLLGVIATFRLRRQAAPRSTRRRILVGFAVAGGALLLLLFGGFAYFGATAPPIQVLSGGQIPKRYVDALQDLGAVEAGEKVRFFYSTGLFDFRDGMYALTDRRLVLANREWAEPMISIPLAAVKELEVHYEDTWLEDTIVMVVRDDGEVFSIPLSTLGRGDRHFVEALREATVPEERRGGAALVQ